MALISGRNLTLGYENQAVVSGLDFTVDEGDYLCIVGENGSGKSTLMKTLLGLIPPLGGTVEKGDALAADQIGYLPQQTAVQRDFPASVREVVLSGCQGRIGLRPFYRKEDKDLAAANMDRMGILPLQDKCYRELSGGQQQRVLLARALCATKKMLLLDEPAAGLDPKVTTELYDLIRSLNQDGITIIMVSHDIQEALKDATHILHIGKNLFFGTRDEYISSRAAAMFVNTASGITKEADTQEQPDIPEEAGMQEQPDIPEEAGIQEMPDMKKKSAMPEEPEKEGEEE